jgi:hypothetical protein
VINSCSNFGSLVYSRVHHKMLNHLLSQITQLEAK